MFYLTDAKMWKEYTIGEKKGTLIAKCSFKPYLHVNLG